ncbi:MAG: FGGY-family carbohydrate kinase [Bryobacteraceae bacterium]
MNEEARKLNFTNEGGVCGTTRFLKNIMGMWLLQGCRKQWQAEGRPYEYADLMQLGSTKPSLASLIDPDDESFLHPRNMLDAIRAFCKNTGQPPPGEPAEFVQCILESLALKYRYVLDSLTRLTGTSYDEIRVVGGGARNSRINLQPMLVLAAF